MARCEYCPFIDPKSEFYDPGIAVMEFYAFGPGCPDQDFGILGGDCYSTFLEEEDELDRIMDLAEAVARGELNFEELSFEDQEALIAYWEEQAELQENAPIAADEVKE